MLVHPPRMHFHPPRRHLRPEIAWSADTRIRGEVALHGRAVRERRDCGDTALGGCRRGHRRGHLSGALRAGQLLLSRRAMLRGGVKTPNYLASAPAQAKALDRAWFEKALRFEKAHA